MGINEDWLLEQKQILTEELDELNEILEPKVIAVSKLDNDIRRTRDTLSEVLGNQEVRLTLAENLNTMLREHSLLLKDVRRMKVKKHKKLANLKIITDALKVEVDE